MYPCLQDWPASQDGDDAAIQGYHGHLPYLGMITETPRTHSRERPPTTAVHQNVNSADTITRRISPALVRNVAPRTMEGHRHKVQLFGPSPERCLIKTLAPTLGIAST